MTLAVDSLYDRVPYRNLPVADAHPDRLATVARLFGLRPAPVETCRILELGCGDGSHLIPIALTLPESRSVGIDLAGVPIATGRKLAAELHLENVVLHQFDLEEVDASLGEFDYIIAHGLYSWVPPATREKLLGICRTNLAQNGVAFVSYNTYPGCHLRDMMRQMLLFQTRDVSDPDLKIKHAYALINFLASSGARTPALAEELESLQSRNASTLFHDDLAGINQPLYFHEFAEQAKGRGLEYLAEAEFKAILHGGLSRETIQTLNLVAGKDRIREQQYLDFLRCRRFRQTLLCQQGTIVPAAPDAAAVMRMVAATPLKAVCAAPNSGSDEEVEFRSMAGHCLRTNLPLAKAALFSMSERWPAAVSFDDLAAEIRLRLAEGPGDAMRLAQLVLELCLGGVVELRTIPLKLTIAVSDRPRAFALARLQAENGRPVTTLRHTIIELEDDLSRRLVTLLDGTRNRADLRRDLGLFAVERGLSGVIRDEDLERNLQRLASLALLEA